MNHLAHLALAGDRPKMVIGGFLGDFVKGQLQNRFEPEIEVGIRLHRAIDAYTDQHPKVTTAACRFKPPYRRYSGIILDVLFDHLLAQNWSDYYDGELQHFSSEALTLLVESSGHLPSEAQQLAKRMHSANSLASFGEIRFLEAAFSQLSQRLTRTNPIANAHFICLELLPDIREDFRLFYTDLQAFCLGWRNRHQSTSLSCSKIGSQ